MTRGGRRWKVLACLAIAAGVLAVLRPWTIQPIATASRAPFDAASYVDSIWQTRLLPEAERTAVDVATVPGVAPDPATRDGSPSRRSLFVKGAGVVGDIDRRSQVGLARVTIAGQTGTTIQIGPVLRGTALRDAATFIDFTDFVNQIEFANVANALNERVSRQVLAALNPDELVGKRIAFIGAATIGGARDGASLEVVPVRIEMSGDAK